MARTSPNGASSDADVLAAAILAPAAAFATHPLLRVVAGGPEMETLTSRLAPLQTLDRLWVVFILIPAAIAFLGIGVPYAFRILLAAVRGRLEREDAITVLALAAAATLVIADLVLARSGLVPLVLTCAVALWRARASLTRLIAGAAPTLFAVAGSSLLGLAYYQRAMRGGAAASVAIAPTLVLVFSYAAILGSLGALLAAAAPGASERDASRRRQGAIGGGVLVGGAAWLVGSRVAHGAYESFESAAGVEVALTVALGVALVGCAWALRIGASSTTESGTYR